MRTSVLVSCLFFAACASSNGGFIDRQTFDCGPGQIVTIQAGLDTSGPRMENVDDQHTLIVNVGNNSSEAIVVQFVRVEPSSSDSAATYRINGGYRVFKQTIAEGDETELKIPLTGRSIRPELDSRASLSANVSLDVTVGLANGDQYRCSFAVAVR
jgi:hypothetical protein